MFIPLRFRTLLLGPLFWSGCAFKPIENADRYLEASLPDKWEFATDSGAVSPNKDSWLVQLGDPQLVEFVAQAMENSYTLKAAMARMAQSEAAVRLKGGSQFPSLGLDFTLGTQENFSEMLGIVKTDIHSLSLSSSWEIDVWGRIRKEQGAAFAQLQSAGFSYADMLLTMQSTVAKTWFSTIEAKLQWQLAIRNRDSFLHHLGTLEERYRKGLVKAFDLRVFRAQSAGNEAIVKQRESIYLSLVMQLQSLASVIPDGRIVLPECLPETNNEIPSQIPSETMLRRPDVRAAERQLAASIGQRDATSKNWLPSFRLSASLGTASNELASLLDGDRLISSLLGSITTFIFQGGRLQAQRDLTEAQMMEQIQLYSLTVTDALKEIETALMREQLLKDVETVVTESASEAHHAELQAWELYNRGLLEITAVLDTQRRSVSAQGELISIRNQSLQNRIDLHTALGGDINLNPEDLISSTHTEL